MKIQYLKKRFQGTVFSCFQNPLQSKKCIVVVHFWIKKNNFTKAKIHIRRKVGTPHFQFDLILCKHWFILWNVLHWIVNTLHYFFMLSRIFNSTSYLINLNRSHFFSKNNIFGKCDQQTTSFIPLTKETILLLFTYAIRSATNNNYLIVILINKG